MEVKAGEMRRNEPAKDAASGSELNMRRSPLAVLGFEKVRDVTNSDGGRVSGGEGEEDEEGEIEKNGGKGGSHWRSGGEGEGEKWY